MKNPHAITNRKFNQAGMVSIMVTIVLMTVMTLIVLGFAQISRRNQREALDRQLSSQAFYAAESGVNDYAKAISSYLQTHTDPSASTLNKSSCGHTSGIYGGVPTSNLTTGVGYTCVQVNATPTSLQYSSVGSSPKVIPLNSADGTTPLNSVTLSWQTTRADLTTPTAGCPAATPVTSVDNFPSSSSWTSSNCGFGVLKVDLVPTTGPQTLTGLQANTMTAVFVPTRQSSTGSGTVSYSGNGYNQYVASANQGAVVAAKCDDTNGCTVKISGLTELNYYLRVSSIYQTSSIQVQGYSASGPSTALELTGAQVLIDSTGKAQDTLRRIQVRLPVNPAGGSLFDAALQSSNSLCKQFQTYPGYAVDASGDPSCSPVP